MNAVAKEMRGNLMRLEEALKQLPEPPHELLHHYAKGIYARELRMQAGTCLTGKLHVTCHMNFLISGTISVMTEDGVKTLTAPAILVSQPGIKRAGYCHTDVIWVTVHGTHERDLEKLEAELIAADYNDPRLSAPGALLEVIE